MLAARPMKPHRSHTGMIFERRLMTPLTPSPEPGTLRGRVYRMLSWTWVIGRP